ncbi:LuxR C-terminal-related transcriptional regulator [Dietzia aurantiaca]|uniref:helix-turn-helix transcriptional regulator n=1 Tax=Dietzia aurantiaca TaxID=983873 RepID=UPI001E587DEE|nr:LuxR C-terminal-related transcriptional regulator [Dietzia aurantiaca]MCD2262734.1 LuxR C-terminal-related transcriptional regulator [Dietzia aurantiaca]
MGGPEPPPHSPVLRPDALASLSGGEQLVVVYAPRFLAVSTLLRDWVETAAPANVAVAPVIDPGRGTDERAYWSALASRLPPRADVAERDDDSPYSAVLARLSALEQPAVLVLDDMHLISDAPARLTDLFDHAPPAGVRIIVACRRQRDLPGPIPCVTSRRVVTPDTLCYGVEEIPALARQRGLSVNVRSPEIIHRLTDGLPALVHAVLDAVPAAQLASPEHLAQYVPGAIDRRMDAEIRGSTDLGRWRRELILSAAASPLNRDSVALLAGPRAAEFTAVLDDLGIAATDGSPTDRRWLFPAPVGDSLLRLAHYELPVDLGEYRNGLINVWLDLDQPNDALKAAADLEDWDRAIAVVREHAGTLYTRDYPVTMGDQVLARIPPEIVSHDPVTRRLYSMHHNFAAPRDAPFPATVEPVGEETDENISSRLLHAVELRVAGQFAKSAQACDPLVDQIAVPEKASRDERELLAMGLVHIGNSFMLTGRFADTIGVTRRGFSVAPEESFVRRDAAGKLALTYAVTGRLTEAEPWLEEERRHAALPAGTEELVRPAGDVAAALLALERGDLTAAADILGDLGLPADREEFWGFILYAHARLALLRGTPTDGVRLLRTELPRFAGARGHGAVAGPLLDAALADLLLSSLDVTGAGELIERSTHPVTAPARARTLLLAGDANEALAIAADALSDLRITTRGAAELRIVAAAASCATGDDLAAERYLSAAVSACRSTGMRCPFLLLPGEVLRTLAGLGAELPVDEGAYPADTGLFSLPAGAQHHPSGAEGGTRVPPAGELGPLSERELVVLRALTSGATNRQIAEAGHVSINTVKTQLRSAFRKLGVSSRGDAVVVARRRGLMQP